MASSRGLRTRLTGLGVVLIVAAAGFVLGSPPATALATQQHGHNNYAGPQECPRPGFDSCTHSTSVVQTSDGGKNVFEAGGDGDDDDDDGVGGTAVQNNTGAGTNSATCNVSTVQSSLQQLCDFTQNAEAGSNTITAAIDAQPSTGSLNLANVVLSSNQKLIAKQSSTTGNNALTATETIKQTANSSLGAGIPVTHTLDSFDLVDLSQVASSTGNNTATITLNRTQTSNATGKSPVQKQDVAVNSLSDVRCSPGQTVSQPCPNGTSLVYQRAYGEASTNYLKLRANDTKSATGKALDAPALGGTVTQTQGHPGAGWIALADVKSPNNATGTTLDMGKPDGSTGGVIKSWTEIAQDALGGTPPGTRIQNDLIQIPILGRSPCLADTYEKTTLVGPKDAQQTATLTADGHADCVWNFAQQATVTTDKTSTATSQGSAPNGQEVHAQTTCTTTCSSIAPTGTNSSGSEGTPSTGQVATFTDANTSDQATAFSASIDWGDGTTSPGAIAGSAGSFTVTGDGTHTYADEGTYNVKTTISKNDDASLTKTVASTATISDAVLTPTGSALSSQSRTLTDQVVGSFTDAYSGATSPGEYTATIDWGDGGATSTGTVSWNGSGFVVKGSHTYTNAGAYTIKTAVYETDAAASTAVIISTTLQTTTVTVSVSDYLGVEGTASGAVATFTDGNHGDTKDDFQATINWGDGTAAESGVISPAEATPGSFVVSGSHSYPDEGSYSPTVTVTSKHDSGISGTATSNALVNDAALHGNGTSISSKSTSVSGLVATFTDENPGDHTSDYTAKVDWSDGTSSYATITYNSTSGSYDVTVRESSAHKYTNPGKYVITVTITDDGGSSTAPTTTVQTSKVSVTAGSVTGTEGSQFSGRVGTFTDDNPNASASDYKTTINWGDGNSSNGTVGGTGPFTVDGTHRYTEEGSYTITVTVTSNNDPAITGSKTAGATIGDAPLTASGKSITSMSKSFSGIVASFTDANTGAPASDFSATIDWGDGQPTSTGTVSSTGNGGFNVSGDHPYSAAGQYNVKVSISDKGGSKASATSTVDISQLTEEVQNSSSPGYSTSANANRGQTVQFRFTYVNTTGKTATGVVVSGKMPTSAFDVFSCPGTCTGPDASGTFRISLGTVPAGQTRVVVLGAHVRTNAPLGTLENSGAVKSDQSASSPSNKVTVTIR